MSVATDTQPEPGSRPDLQVVRDEDPPEPPPEHDTEITGPVPVLDSEGNPVAARAPIDVRLKEAAVGWVAARPRMATRPPSMAETLEHSQRGDWAAADNGAKRAVHGLATLLSFVLTYPLDVVLRSRDKPIAFVLTIAVLITLTQLL
ncbi:hypothetical protein FHS23_004622 [Prauserella isguenensis]|uniref:Uncharacterized protein n=1 Tax=Prauserella isguenensis TaxID=1470180 RepID=A0A839S7B9_9PSEU|nr:hypothetical protein [Prauserella isguenensis]MBB3053568.1 hypothetical protein [Prauserella isguenensis]